MAENLPDTNVGNIEYIRKADAIDDLHTQLMYRMGSDDMKRRLDDWVKTLPPADVAPVVHGRWIWKPTKQYCPSDCWYPPCNEETWDEKNGTWLEDEMYCSECNYNNYHEIKYNFCPNCGAKMDKE